MERRTGLAPMSAKRRAELLAAGRWVTSTLHRSTGLARQRPLRPGTGSERREYTGPSEEAKALLARRCEGWCEWPGCRRRARDPHHRLNRKSGGRHGDARLRINGVAWLVALCRRHHEQVTSPVGDVRIEAELNGWILREHQNALLVPVLTKHHPKPVYLTPDGGWTTRRPASPTTGS